jgi:hypothetical protein
VKTADETGVKTWRKLFSRKTREKTFHEKLSQVLSADLGGALLRALLGALLVGVLGRQISSFGISVAGEGWCEGLGFNWKANILNVLYAYIYTYYINIFIYVSIHLCFTVAILA